MTLSLAQIAHPRPLRACSIEELAVHQITAMPSGGVMFARKKERDAKDEARSHILNLLGNTLAYPTLSILTMPGLQWRFENKLLGRRERDWATKPGQKAESTAIEAIESDRSIFYGAVTMMPGMADWKHRRMDNPPITMLQPSKFAERAVANPFVERFSFGNVDDLMRHAQREYDAAWLDYTGPMSVERLRVIAEFYRRCIRSLLVVTSMRARWNRESSDTVARHGSVHAWLRSALPGPVLHEIDYQDGPSPMSQFAVLKADRRNASARKFARLTADLAKGDLREFCLRGDRICCVSERDVLVNLGARERDQRHYYFRTRGLAVNALQAWDGTGTPSGPGFIGEYHPDSGWMEFAADEAAPITATPTTN
jgi:hypothetical protein